MTADIAIAVGFYSSIETAGYPGFLDGGIRIVVDGTVLTRYTERSDGLARYDVAGAPLSNPDEYVGEELHFDLIGLKEAAVKFLNNENNRYESIPAVVTGEPGIGTITLSFCDGEHTRIAFQPRSAEYSEYFPTEGTVGYAVDPIELCRELIEGFETCVTFAERAYGEYDDMTDEMNEVREWADKQSHPLREAIDSTR